MRNSNMPFHSNLKFLLTALLVMLSLSLNGQVFAKGKAVNTWYKVSMKGVSETVKVKKISLIIPGKKAKNQKVKLKLGNKTLYPKVKSNNMILRIVSLGSGSQPTAQGGVSSTTTIEIDDGTVTVSIDADEKGNVVVSTTKTTSTGSTTTTTSTDSDGNTQTTTTKKDKKD